MIRVKVDMLPHGSIEKQYPLKSLEIYNKGPGDSPGLYNYGYKVFAAYGRTYRTGEIKNYPREKYTVWRLVQRCLDDAFGREDSDAKTGANDAYLCL